MYLTIIWRNSLLLLSVQHLQCGNNLDWSDIYWTIANINLGDLYTRGTELTVQIEQCNSLHKKYV